MHSAPDAEQPDDRRRHETAEASCRRDGDCWCPPRRADSDLETLLATPGFTGTVLPSGAGGVTPHLPLLEQVVGVTVAGPVIMNDVGTHHPPVGMGGPIRCDASRITLRLNTSRLGSALVTDPAAHIPPTLRLFDTHGNTAHATYLTERSDRLAFESMALAPDPDAVFAEDALAASIVDRSATPEGSIPEMPGEVPSSGHGDQIDQFDSILTDGGFHRLSTLPGEGGSGVTRVASRRVIAALEHAALLGMPMTVATAAPGCLQMRHDQLDGAREHRGSMVVASGTCRTMINFNLVTECWVTWSQGAWGRTGSIELYDRHARCSLIATQTGTVSAETFTAWEHLMTDLADG